MRNKQNINIAYFAVSIEKGGAENLLLMLCSELKKANSSVIPQLVVLERKKNDLFDKFYSEKIKVTYLDINNSFFRLKDFFKLLKWFTKNKPSIVHTHAGANMDRFILLAAFFSGIKVRICTIHNMDQRSSIRARFSYRIVSTLSKKIIAVSNEACSFYKKNSFFNKKKLSVIYNCPGFKQTQVIPRNKGVAGKNTITLLNIGGLRIQKGQLYLLEAIQQLNSTKYKFQLDIYGADRFEYGSILFHKKTEANLKNVFFHGEVDDIQEKYNDTDMIIASSIREAMPLVVLEAISMGIPLIATNIPPHREVLEPIPGHILVETHSGEAIAKAILNLVEDQERYIGLSKAELIRARDFSTYNTVKNHLDLYKEFLNF